MATYYIDSYDELNSIEGKIGDIVVLVGKGSFQAISTTVSNDSGTMQMHSKSSSPKSYFPPVKGKGGKIKKYRS